jgi:putative ABC transport system substrate-binding protein
VASLAKPGGIVAGVFIDVADFAATCLQILAEAVACLSRIGVRWDPSTGGYQRAAAELSAARMGIALDLRLTNTLVDVESAVWALAANGVGALLILSSPLFAASTGAIAAMANVARLPAIMLLPDSARYGGLVAYGPDIRDLFRRAGAMARRIVDGARASDLPVERPVRFNLILNLRTERTLGLEPRPLLLARADEVVE